MHRQIIDHWVPDREAFVAAEPPTGRVIVIAPTRAACETIEVALGLDIETFLEKTQGPRVRALAASGKGFGIVAGTGTGKTLAVRPIAETILGTTDLRIGVVNREREATPETPTWNVIIVTTGIARRWFEEGDILPHDTLVVDEIHQTSAELELCLALGKRVGCRFIWLSATVDPTFYARYLDSADVLQVHAFDQQKAARVRVENKEPLEFLDDRFLKALQREQRGVALFVPTRKGVEQAAMHVQEMFPRMNVAFYHGGEPIRTIREFIEGTSKPFFLAMTAAGQSALNIKGLDTVIIDDTRFTNIIEKGKNVLTRLNLGANEILQMAGRVHGRVEGGRVFILSDRDLDFHSLQPTEPEFQLAGDSERVAMTCAAIGIRADELELPVPLDRVAYRRAMTLLESRHIVVNGRLTPYGRSVESMPVDRAWAELLVNADDALVPYLAVMSAIESLHRMTREERDLDGLVVPGSDHLTAYNVYAEAYAEAGHIGEVYGLPRHLFDEKQLDEWAERRGVLVKSIEDTALAMASVYRAVNLPLPERMPNAGDATYRAFADLLAQYMPFQLVIDEQAPWGEEVRVSKGSVCGSWGAIAGDLRYFADRFGVPRASIEGTQIPYDIVRTYAKRGEGTLAYDDRNRRSPLVMKQAVTYYGFELERESEPVDEPWPAELAPRIRRVLAESLAREEARHKAVPRNRPLVAEVREVWRRSGGLTKKLGLEELTALYEAQLAEVDSYEDFRAAPLRIDLGSLVTREERDRWAELPDVTAIRDKAVDIEYDVEEIDGRPQGVARLKLPAKLARTLAAEELPELDRPLRFVVHRGQRSSVRASTLEALQELLDRPWSPEEVAEEQESRHVQRERAFEERAARKSKKQMGEAAGGLRRLREGAQGRSGRPGKRERAERAGRGESASRGPRPPRGGRPTRTDRPDRAQRTDRTDRPARPDRSARPASTRGERRGAERRDASQPADEALRDDRSSDRRRDDRKVDGFGGALEDVPGARRDVAPGEERTRDESIAERFRREDERGARKKRR